MNVCPIGADQLKSSVIHPNRRRWGLLWLKLVSDAVLAISVAGINR